MPGDSAGQIGLDLVVNRGPFQQQMAGIMDLAKKAGKALAGAFAVKKIVDFGKECIELGSDLAEVQNVVDVTFPEMSAKVDAFAKSAAASFGLSETMAKQYTGAFGAMAKAFGFTEQQAYDMGTSLTALAGDVASFYNLSQDEAYTKLKSVFTGETESLKDLGVVMTQSALDSYALANGYGKVTSKMTEGEKVALRYAFVQEQLSAAAGDFARTSDGWANQTRILSLQFDSLKASIGQGLINLFTPVLRMVNILIGRLAVLAEAFKSFTELITGNKSDGVGDVAEGAQAAGAGLGEAADSAGNLADNTEGVGKAAKKAAKDMKNLMGFDKINRLTEDDSDGSAAGTIAGSAAGNVDYGSLAEGETVMDRLGKAMQKLISKAKELASLFKKGFVIGFGDSSKRMKDLIENVKGIGKSLKDVFADGTIISAADRMFQSFALSAGKLAGSYASVGVTIATNLTGGIRKYLEESAPYIKEKLVSIFDIQSEIYGIEADFAVALADVLTVFSGENATDITASIIGIFADGFLGAQDIALRFSRDVLDLITGPFIENKDKIKEAIDNTLAPVSELLDTLHQSVKHTFEKMAEVYDKHVKPMFDSFKKGFGEILGTLLDGYNKHIAPVLSEMSKKATETWNNYVQPVIDQSIELLGKLADSAKEIWEKTLQPFLNWIARNIMPVVAPIIETLGGLFLGLVKTVSGAASGILTALGGVIDFITGVFTGDWRKAWNGVKTIFKGVWDAFKAIVRTPVNTIIGFINSLLDGVEGMVNGVADALNTISIDLPDWLQDLTGYGSVGFDIPTWSAPQIPYLAQGGFVEKNTPQLAVIGDNRHQGEVTAPEDKLREMAADAVRAAGNGGVTREELEGVVNNATMRIVAALASVGFYLDGEQVATLQRTARTGIDRRFNAAEIGV